MGNFAVIDTETNWDNRVMSVGIVVAREDFSALDKRYYILDPECQVGGMYDSVLELVRPHGVCSRRKAMKELRLWLLGLDVERLFAYNARFDRNHLPELGDFCWFDIMRIAAYRQYNPAIPADALCCSTGRLKSHYGVEPITRMLSGDESYRETHNALLDARDELAIMRLLGLSPADYQCAAI